MEAFKTLNKFIFSTVRWVEEGLVHAVLGWTGSQKTMTCAPCGNMSRSTSDGLQTVLMDLPMSQASQAGGWGTPNVQPLCPKPLSVPLHLRRNYLYPLSATFARHRRPSLQVAPRASRLAIWASRVLRSEASLELTA